MALVHYWEKVKMVVNMTVKGIKKTQVYLNSKKNKINFDTTVGLRKAALFMQGEVKLSIAGHKAEPTSVDTGRFLSSVNVQVGKKDAKIFSKIPYSKYLEFGTSRIRARRHFQNSKDRNKGKVKEILQNSIKV